MIFAGIDPGLSGAIAFLDETGEPAFGGVYDTPVLAVARSAGGQRRVLDQPAMVALLRTVPADELAVVLEQVGPMPGQGVTSMFRFGEGFGVWQGILSALQVRHVLVRPQTWQKAMLAGVVCSGGASIIVARRRWPRVDLHRVKDHGRADALLLAEYGRTRAFASVAVAP